MERPYLCCVGPTDSILETSIKIDIVCLVKYYYETRPYKGHVMFENKPVPLRKLFKGNVLEPHCKKQAVC